MYLYIVDGIEELHLSVRPTQLMEFFDTIALPPSASSTSDVQVRFSNSSTPLPPSCSSTSLGWPSTARVRSPRRSNSIGAVNEILRSNWGACCTSGGVQQALGRAILRSLNAQFVCLELCIVSRTAHLRSVMLSESIIDSAASIIDSVASIIEHAFLP